MNGNDVRYGPHVDSALVDLPGHLKSCATSEVLYHRLSPRRRGAADCGEYREAAGAIALNVIVGTGSNTRGECNMPKCELARRSQLAQARRPEYQTSEYLRGFQRSHSRYCPWHQPARQ